jgi:amino acid transporter
MGIHDTFLNMELFFASIILAFIWSLIGSFFLYYYSQKEQSNWLIEWYRREETLDLREIEKNEYLKERGKWLFWIFLAALIVIGIALLCVFFVFADLTNQTKDMGENATAICPQNITYVVNNYYSNYTIERIVVENKNRSISVEELKFLMQSGKVGQNRSFYRY